MFARFFGFGVKEESNEEVKPETVPSPSLAEASGDLFKYYYSENESEVPSKFYLKEMDISAKIVKSMDHDSSKQFAFVMKVFSKAGDCILVQDIHPHMQLETYEVTNSFIWTSIVLEGPQEGVHKWSIIFTQPDQKGHFLFELKRCMYETSTQMPFQKVKEEDQDFCLEANDLGFAAEEEVYDPAVDFLAFDGLSISENAQERRRRLADAKEQESDSDDDVTTGAAPKSTAKEPLKGDFNSLLVDSARHKKTFVVRGNAIGVFNRDEDCQFDTEISDVKGLDGKGFTPARVMLHDCDSRLVMLNDNDPNKVYPLDLETGKVVEEWKVDKDGFLKVVNFNPSTKHGGMLGEQTLVALASSVVVGLDSRLSDAAKAIGNPFDYIQTSNPKFTCCATTAKGHLAVGTAKGEIKFFVGVPGMPHTTSSRVASCPKTAKTMLPGLGDEIIGMDLTSDGAWVLATCKKYLLLISTLTPDAASNGFETRLGKDKPRPRRLCLAPEDQEWIGRNHSFTPASFNYGRGEMFIVTSMGPYIITWNFRLVQQGNVRAYVIKRTSSDIMSEQFFAVLPDQDGHDAPIVLAHRDDVSVEKRRPYDRNPWLSNPRPQFERSSESNA